MPRRLDKSKSFGTITPPQNGALFHQDGGYFNGAGDLVWEDHPPAPPKTQQSEVTTVDAAGNQQTVIVETEVKEEVADKKGALIAWLKGELDPEPPFMTVRSWGKAVFGRALTKAQLIDAAVDGGLVSAEQVKA